MPSSDQGKEIGILFTWLLFLSVPILYITSALKWPIKAKGDKSQPTQKREIWKLVIMFGVIPALMVMFATRPVVSNKHMPVMMGMVFLYVILWLMEGYISNKKMVEALDPSTSGSELWKFHTINISILFGLGVTYILTGNTKLFNTGNSSSGYGGYGISKYY